MFNLTKSDSRPPPASVLDSTTKSGQDIGATQREMVYTAFKDTVRATGIPTHFLTCECVTMVDAHRQNRIQVCLIYKKWSGQMLRYSQAFQKQMRTCLDRYEPNVDHASYEWVWKYAADCDTPFPAMPSPEEWNRKKEAPPPPPPAADFFERRKAPRPPKPVA